MTDSDLRCYIKSHIDRLNLHVERLGNIIIEQNKTIADIAKMALTARLERTNGSEVYPAEPREAKQQEEVDRDGV